MQRAARVVAVLLLVVAAGVAVLPFSTTATFSTVARLDDPDVRPAPTVVSGDCRPPAVEAWPSGRDRVQAVGRGAAPPAYEAVGGRLHRSCDGPATRRLALSAALLLPAGLLVALVARSRAPAA